MVARLILASNSRIRATLLSNAGLDFEVEPARVDEESIRLSLESEGAPPRDIADTLAEAKARKVAGRHPGAMVLGCDQVLAHDRRILAKPETPEEARAQLKSLAGSSHKLLSAAVLYEEAKPIWRHVGEVRMTMRSLSDAYISDYVDRNWDSIRWSVGAYKLEEEGVRLFTEVKGDYFTVLGLPLLDFISFLTLRGTLPS